MSKIKNCFAFVCHNKKDTKLSISYRWALFLIFQLLIALLVVQPNALAGLSNLSVDANGDNVFNGKDDGEKLTISFTTSDFGDEPVDGVGGQQYEYDILVDHNGEKTIFSGPGTGDTLSKNQTVEFVWNGTFIRDNTKPDERQMLPDGEYTITVKLTGKPELPLGQVVELTAQVVVDTKAPEVNISIEDDAFSPDLYSLAVYYDIDEDASESWLEFQRAPGNANIGRRVPLSTSSGSHTFYWDGSDNSRRDFFDGQYTLRVRVKDKGGNEAESGKTGNITIDTEEPRITSITLNDSIPLTNGKFVNTSIETINFTADDPDGTGVNLTGRDTEVLIRPVGGRNLSGAMTFGNKATFTLGDALDALEENGEYEVTAFISDNVGNLTSSRIRFTFDNAAPILKSIATDTGEFTAGSGLSGTTNYVEATLEDNIELNLADSTIKLKGPSGSDVLGQQTRPADDKIRWQLLTPLSVEDGIHDGQYTIEVVGADKAGNRTTPIQITFLFDNLAPELVSVQPTRDGEPFNILGDTVYYNLPLNQFVVTYDDGEFGTGVVLSGAQDKSIVFGTPNADGGIDAISGRAFPDINNNVLTYILDKPLLNSDGSQDGTYRLDVVATDVLGNSKSYSYNLIYDTQVPTLTSTVPAANQSVKDLSQVVVKLNETTSGIDFVQSTFALKRNVDGNQVEVPVDISSNGADTATLTLLQPIALDGSDDGTYVIEVTPTDRAGNVGSVIRREFYLVSQARPEIKLTTPETGTVNSLGDITVELVDYIGTGINLDASTITVRNAQGQIVPQSEVVSDPTNNSLTWSTEVTIPQNGSADGRYTISATYRDFTGVSFTQTFYLTLDTQFPAISSVQVGTDTQNLLSLDSITDVTDSFSHIDLDFDASDVDFENTVVTLVGPDGNEIAVRRTNDGAGLLTLNFQNLAELGTYTLTVTPVDNIGNVSESPFIYRFNLDIAVPVVTSVVIGGQIGGLVYVNGAAAEIVATIADTTGIGIAIGDNDSKITVTSEIGLPVPGITTINDENQLVWRPAVLPSDGSADGRYTVSVTPVDKAGRTGDVAYRAFIYDTQSPQITAATPITLHQPISYVGDSLTQFQFTVEDFGPALLDLDDQTIGFAKNSGEDVAGHITHDNNNQLFFTLSSPLPTDGSADGEYTLSVNLVDKAGNSYQVQHNIVYDSQAPQLSSVTLNTETPINLVPYQVVDLSESISKITLNFIEMARVDFANTTITLMGPDGSSTPLTLENNGIDEITANFVTLTQDGLYTLTVTSQDLSGNVAQGAVPYPFRLKFEVPELTAVRVNSVASSYELTSYDITDISDVINSLTLEFTDAMRVDFETTRVTLTAPDGQGISITQGESEGNKFMVRFVPLTLSGLYTLSVTPQDIDGNVAQSPNRYQFRLEISLPAVGSVHIDGNLGTNILTNNPDTAIVATFVDATGVGLTFGDEGSNITVTNDQGLVVSGNTSITGTNQLTWIPAALPDDGSADGRYTVTITPVDKSGRTGTVVSRHFIYDTQAPRITNATPIMLHQPLSYIGGNLSQFQFTVEDVGPALLDLDDQTIGLEKKNGEVVIGQLTHDGANQLYFTLLIPLPTDGSADGEYTLTTNIVDKVGNSIEDQHNIYYDSQVPSLSSVTLNTETPTSLNPYQITDLSESVNQLTLEFTETTRVDFGATVISLTGPNNSPIPLTLENNGVDQITASFVTLTQMGSYTLSVTPHDIAGNAAQGAVQYPFRLKFDVPGLASATANAGDDSFELIQHEIIETSIYIDSFTLGFTNPQNVDFENTEVNLRGPDGQEILVTVEENDANQLMVRFVPLEQSGLYTLSITPQDHAGNVAKNAVSFQFELIFEMPELASVTANTADTSINLTPYEILELSESVNGFILLFSDGSRVDLENTSVVLTGPNGQQIPVTREDDDDVTLTVRFVSLEQSGLYTLSVTPQDIDGNVAKNAVSFQFELIFEMPELASVTANTADASVNLTPYEILELSESVSGFTLLFTDGSRVNLESTSVVLTGPNGQQIPVTTEDDDDVTLTVRFVSLEQSGLYTLSVIPQDIDGNAAQNAISYQFRLKFEVPELASVKVHGTDNVIDLIQHDIVEISEAIGSITLEFTDPQRVDFENTSVTLSNPNGQEISVSLEDDENNYYLMVHFVPLTQSGIYTLTVTPQDQAGNVAQRSTRYQFRLDTTLPSVNAILIDGKVGSTVYVRSAVPRIIANITDSIGVGVAHGDDGSTIVVTNSQGIEVSGTTTFSGTNQLTWIPTPLPVDGSADGQYTVVITPVDKSGRTGTSVRRQFIYDTQAPRITSATPIVLHAPISYIGSGLDQFVLTVEDVGPADITFASQVVALMDGTGKQVPSKLTYDELTNQLYLSLDTPFASDGSADGPYALNVLLIDNAGNRLSTQYELVYDSKMPEMSSVQVNTVGTPMDLTPNQVAELTESVDTITIKFNETTRVDFENTNVSLLDPSNQPIPLTVGDDGVSQMTLNFVALTQIGQYTLSITPQDIAGNTAQSPIVYAFNLEFILPEVESVIIGDTVTLGSGHTVYANDDNLVIVVNLLDPSGTGLSFDTTTGSDVIVATLDGIIVPGSTATNGTDVLVWRPLTLSNDGSSDGRYAVYVYPVDKKGREGITVYREFIYDTQEPEIISASPIDLSQPVTYMSESLTQFQFTIQDVGLADITLEDQEVSLRSENGVLIPTKLTNDKNNQLFLTLDEPLPLDGSRDGQYTVVIAFSDKAGNVLSVNHPIVYDTQAPTLVSTVPADSETLTEDITQIQVNLDDKGDSGIDWSRTTVTLIDPNGNIISGDLSSDGKSRLTLNTNQLVADGRYVIQVQAIDRAGNGSRSVHETDFLLSRRLPAIVSTVPITAPEDEAYTNEKVEEIEVLLETVDVRHLSTVRLLTSEGQEIAGQQHRETGKLIYRLVRPLATDGSEDGDYTIEFTPISSSGRSGAAQSLVFTYDTQSPELDPKDVHLIVAEPQVDNSLVRIRLDITDNHAGVDWENLDTDWVTFERISPDPTKINGSVLDVLEEPAHLIFTLNVPLADDGSADGKYKISVTPIDKAGNGDETYEKEFTYDTSPPVIDLNSLLINDAPLLTDIEADDYPSAVSTTGGVVIQAIVSDTGLGVNLSQSRINVANPNGQEISGTTRQNGVDTLVFKSDGLNVEGIYRVTIIAIGNDTEQLGISPQGSVTAEFLYETTIPTAVVTDDGGKTELTDEALPLQGTAADPQGTRRAGPQGESEIPVPASGVWLVEVVGTGPDGQPIEPVPAEDDSDAEQEPWSRWKADFLPTRSGEYDLDIRVTDKAGNYAVYDYGEVTMSVSFTFSGNTFVYPNPLRQSNDDVGFFSFELNTSDDTVEMNLHIYDWSGDMVHSKTYGRINPEHRNGNQVQWGLKNNAGNRVARGIYVFRLEAVDGAGNRANAVGKILVVD